MNRSISIDKSRDISYSLRRYYVDEFHLRQALSLKAGSSTLDLGGNRTGKRGQFDIERFGLDVTYANLSLAKNPHVGTDAAKLPFREGSFDYVICSELLEHVPDPVSVIREIHCVLKRRGVVVICSPFNFPIHGDPSDYGRYTNFYWKEVLESCGFGDITIEFHGGFWSVMADMSRHWVYSQTREWGRERAMSLNIIGRVLGILKRKAITLDIQRNQGVRKDSMNYTTGFGVTACKL